MRLRSARILISGAAVRALLVAAVISGHFQPLLTVQKPDQEKPHHHHSKPAVQPEEDHQTEHLDLSQGHRRMLRTLKKVANDVNRKNPYLGGSVVRDYRRQLEELDQRPAAPDLPAWWNDLNRWKVPAGPGNCRSAAG